MSDFVLTSGRESLPAIDRAALLDADLSTMDLDRCPKGCGSDVHAFNETRSRIRWAAQRMRAAVVSATTLEFASRTECRAMAWKRGGYAEWERVRRAQYEAGHR